VPPSFGQLGGVLKVDGVCCFHAAASVTPAMGNIYYAMSCVLPSRAERGALAVGLLGGTHRSSRYG